MLPGELPSPSAQSSALWAVLAEMDVVERASRIGEGAGAFPFSGVACGRISGDCTDGDEPLEEGVLSTLRELGRVALR